MDWKLGWNEVGWGGGGGGGRGGGGGGGVGGDRLLRQLQDHPMP